MHVKELLGHKSANSTMIYITIEKAMFKYTEEEYTSKVAHTIEEAQKFLM